MAGVAYVDSSALLKLAVAEPETSALEADLAGRDGLVASRLAALECRRAARRTSNKRVLQAVDEVLDAIHLATALSIDEPVLDVITYDRRLAEAAEAAGLRVVQPGR